jgi:hypothetical protein
MYGMARASRSGKYHSSVTGRYVKSRADGTIAYRKATSGFGVTKVKTDKK